MILNGDLIIQKIKEALEVAKRNPTIGGGMSLSEGTVIHRIKEAIDCLDLDQLAEIYNQVVDDSKIEYDVDTESYKYIGRNK